jgi:hypothetical protein
MSFQAGARVVVWSTVLIGAGCFTASLGAPTNDGPPAFQDFARRVKDFMKVRNDILDSMPRQKTTKARKQIIERRSALAEKIREVRASAKQGDIFSPEASEAFRQVIRDRLQGPGGSNVRKTIRQGEPLKGWRLTVNGDYPGHLPLTTMPPALLMALPELPKDLAYRIIGRDFVLEDIEARVIIDFIPEALP